MVYKLNRLSKLFDKLNVKIFDNILNSEINGLYYPYENYKIIILNSRLSYKEKVSLLFKLTIINELEWDKLLKNLLDNKDNNLYKVV